MKPSCNIVLLLLVLLSLQSLPLSAQTLEGDSLYQASVRVVSRADERERSRAFSTGLQQVLTRVSGSLPAVNPVSIRQALNNPEAYVDSWIYRTLPASQPGTDAVIELQVSFFPAAIQNLLAENNIPLWPRNRPETLVWLVVQDELGERRMTDGRDEATRDIRQSLEQMGELRGLPLLFPMMDLEDRLSLDTDALWGLNEASIRAASRRYQAQSILAIRLYRSLSGELLGRSLYMFRDSPHFHEAFNQGLEAFLGSSIDMVVRELSDYYAVLLSPTAGDAVTVRMRIDDVASPQDYAAVLAYINTLDSVQAFQLARVEQGALYLNLDSRGQLRQLIEAIALERRLEAIAEMNREGDEVTVHYRWVQN